MTPSPPAKLTTGPKIILGIAAAVTVVCMCVTTTGIVVKEFFLDDLERTSHSSRHVVTYAVDGTAQALVLFNLGRGPETGILTRLPFQNSVTVTGDNLGLSVSARPTGGDLNIFGCHILVDGHEVMRASARGGVVMCTYAYTGKG